MKINIIPTSDIRLEKNQIWRLVKVWYFTILSIGSWIIYSLLNSWYYTGCTLNDSSISWEKRKEFCIKFFDYTELFFAILISIIFFRLIFPIFEKAVVYVMYGK